MLAEFAVIVVILATVSCVYLKSTLIKSFVILINAFISSTIAMAFFETLSGLVAGYGGEWTQGAVFLFIFVIVLAILNAAGDRFAPANIHFGDFPDRAARSLVGAFAGFVIAGVILLAAAMLPIGTKWPYERFNSESISISQDKPKPNKLFLNADGFVAGFTSRVSRGSMAGKKSFALVHPDFVNEIHLNRIGKDKNNLPK